MMAATPPQYLFVTTTLSTGAVIDEMPFSSVQFSRAFNKNGVFKGIMTIEEPLGALNRVHREAIKPGGLGIWVLSDGVPVWGGVIWDVEANLGKREIVVTANGFTSYLYRRILTQNLSYEGVDQISIMEGLIDWANNQAGGDIGMSVLYPGGLSGVTRDLSYLATDMNTIGELFEQMGEYDNGVEWYEEYTGRVDGNVDSLQHYVHIGYPRVGRDNGLVFDTQKNVQLLTWKLNAEKFINRAHGFNIAGDTKIQVSRSIPYGGNPLLEEAVAFTEELTEASVLSKTQKYLTLNSNLPDVVSVVVDANDGDIGLGTFVPGDTVRVVSALGYVDIDADYRILGYTVDIDENSHDTMTVELAEARAFNL